MTTVTAVSSTKAAAVPRIRFSTKWLTHLTLLILAIIWLTPTVGLLVTSFRPRDAIATSGWWTSFSPARFTLENYQQVLTAQGMDKSFINSFIITLPGTILPVIIGALAAYAFSWVRFRGRDTLFLVIVALL